MAVLGELGGAESGGLEVSSSARVLERSSPRTLASSNVVGVYEDLHGITSDLMGFNAINEILLGLIGIEWDFIRDFIRALIDIS